MAKAFYKGYIRILQKQTYDPFDQPFNKKGRQAWLKQRVNDIEKDPKFFVMHKAIFDDRKKDSRAFLIGVDFIDGHQEDETEFAWTWLGSSVKLHTRRFQIVKYRIPVLITSHLIERAMLRLKLEQPVAALKALTPAFFAAIALEKPVPGQVYLQATGGVVVAKPHETDPTMWALVTFVDQDKLRPEQIREAKFWEDISDDIMKRRQNA